MTLTHRGIKVLGVQPLENVLPHIVQPDQFIEKGASDNGRRYKKIHRTYSIGGQFYRVKMSGQRMALLGRERECACCGHTGVLFRLESSGCYSPHFNLYGAHESGLILMTMDHINPRSCGGKTFPGNLQLLCKICNEKKKNRPITLEVLREELEITQHVIDTRRKLAADWIDRQARYHESKRNSVDRGSTPPSGNGSQE